MSIQSANVDSITQLARWGKGWPFGWYHYSPDGEVLWSPDNKLLAVASSIGVYLYDARTTEEVQFIDTSSWVRSMDFSPDGKVLALGGGGWYTDTVQLWRISDGALLQQLGGEQHSGITSIAFSPDGSLLAFASGYTALVWDLDTMKHIHTIEHEGLVTDVTFSPDGGTLAYGTQDGLVKLWHVADWSPQGTFGEQLGAVRSLEFSPDGTVLATIGQLGEVQIWQVSNASLLHSLEKRVGRIANGGYSLAFSPDSKLLATGLGEGLVQLWQVQDGLFLDTLQAHADYVVSVAFSPDGKMLASGSVDATVRLWRVSDRTLANTIDEYTGPVLDVDFSPDDAVLASGSGVPWYLEYDQSFSDNAIRLWRVSDGTLLCSQEGHNDGVTSIAFSPDGELLASGAKSNDGSELKLWRVGDSRLELLQTLDSYLQPVWSVAFSRDGSLLASGAEWEAHIWRIPDGSRFHDLPIGVHRVGAAVVFSPDNTLLIIGIEDNPSINHSIELWRVSDGEYLDSLGEKGVTSLALSPDGTLLAAGMDYGVSMWRVSDWQYLRLLDTRSLEYGGGTIESVDFSPNGALLAAGTRSGSIWLWQVEDGTLLRKLEGHTSTVRSVTFSHDGTLLASGSEDGTVRLWGIAR